jgi:spermidine/putrescine transport system substrate-binding protein
MDKHNDGELRLLAPASLKPKLDRVAALARQAGADQGVKVSRRQALGLGGLALLIAGCGGTTGGSSSTGGGATSTAASRLAGKPLESNLLIYNFSEYLDPRTRSGFHRANPGTTVKETYYSSSDEMEAKIKAGGGDYDIIVPGQNSIAPLGQGGYLYALDHSLIPNMANLQPQWKDLDYDKGNKYTVVKNWGYVGFYYRNDLIDSRPTTFMEFLEGLPAAARKGRTNMLEGTTTIIGDTMIAMGLDPDSENQADYDKAVKFLTPLAAAIKTLDASTYRPDTISGKIVYGQGWSGDMLQIAEERRDVTVVAPDGPCERFADNWAIPAKAPHPVAAHAWINYLLDPQVGLQEMKFSKYGTANAKTWALPGAREFASNPIVNLEADKINKYKFIISPTPKVLNLRQQAYEKFRATR